jgi:hypothetical protein
VLLQIQRSAYAEERTHVALEHLVDDVLAQQTRRLRHASRRSAAATTALAALLYWRARYRAIGAIDAAIARLRFEDGMTLLAFVEPLAGIGGHRLDLCSATLGTGQRRFRGDSGHLAVPVAIAEWPLSWVARIWASTLGLASSKLTSASRNSRLTTVLLTPDTLVSAA